MHYILSYMRLKIYFLSFFFNILQYMKDCCENRGIAKSGKREKLKAFEPYCKLKRGKMKHLNPIAN